VSCAKTVELIEMQFGMLSRPGNMYYMGCRCPHGRGTVGVSGLLKSIVKYRMFRVG